MEAIRQRCAGLDVHKQSVTVCAMRLETSGRVVKEVREFGTMTSDLLAMTEWLASWDIGDVAMESTGVFWKPIFNLMEDRFGVTLVNAKSIKHVPGRKTDVKDSEWIAQLHLCGLLTGSFIPPRPQRELRDLTRERAQAVGEKTRVINRIHKVLEDANIKLASVASDALGKSGRDMIEAIIAGNEDATQLAELARRRMRGKIPQLRKALEGRVHDHHRFLLKGHLKHMDFLEEHITQLESRIGKLIGDNRPAPNTPAPGPALDAPAAADDAAPLPDASPTPSQTVATTAPVCAPLDWTQTVNRLCEIPGVATCTAQNVLAEIGSDMSRFATADHLNSWARICPGNEQSAGKRKSAATGKGNRWLRRTLAEAAWAASHTKDTYLSAQYRRIAKRRGKKRAIVALGHTLLTIIYYLLKHNRHYKELGGDFFDRMNPERVKKYHVSRLQSLGYSVVLEPKTVAA